jgi:hypothetical protein
MSGLQRDGEIAVKAGDISARRNATKNHRNMLGLRWSRKVAEEPTAAERKGVCVVTDKPTNPKDAVASGTKVPLHLFPVTAIALGAMSLLFGALKYGRNNWRHDGARASVYAAAAMRHLKDWEEGYDKDEDGLDNIGAAIASLAIICDARAAGKLVDDRNYPGGSRALMVDLSKQVGELISKYGDRNPRHYIISTPEQEQ